MLWFKLLEVRIQKCLLGLCFIHSTESIALKLYLNLIIKYLFCKVLCVKCCISHGYLDHGLPGWLSGKESVCQCRRCGFSPWVRKIPWREAWQPTPVFLPGKSYGQRSLVDHSLWDWKESDTIKQLTTHTFGPQL